MEIELLHDITRASDPLNSEWVTAMFLAMFTILAYTNISSPKKWRVLYQGLFRMRLGRQTLREEIDLLDRTFLGLLLVAISVLSLFVWQLFVVASGSYGPPYGRWFLTVSAVVIGHGIMLRSLIGLFRTEQELSEHLSTGTLLFILTGMALLPLCVLIAYRPEWRTALFMCGSVVIAVLLVYRWVRGVWIGLGEGVPVRYIFIYICAAEVIPVLLLVRAFR